MITFNVHTAETRELLVAAATTTDTHERSVIEEQVVRRHLSLVHSLTARYDRRGVDRDDLVQVASVALVSAMRRFDPAKGDFVAYARSTILGEIKHHFRDSCWTIRPPRRLQELQADVSAVADRHTARGGRRPSPAEIASELDVSVRDVRKAMVAAENYSPRSLDQPTGINGLPLGETVACEECDYDLVDEWSTLTPLCRTLSADDRRLLVLRFVEDRTQREIGKDLGVSQMEVSRRLRRLLGQLRTRASTVAVA